MVVPSRSTFFATDYLGIPGLDLRDLSRVGWSVFDLDDGGADVELALHFAGLIFFLEDQLFAF